MASGNYNLTAKNSSGCISAITTVTVNAQPATPAAPTATVTAQPSCTISTGTITITAPAGTGITYSTDGVTYTNTTGVFSGMASGNYNLTAKNSSGCISAITTVTVNAQPATPAAPTITAGGSTTFCAGGTVTLTSSAGTSYLWSTGATTASISPTTSGSYSVQVTNGSGCQSASSAAIVVTVNALPATPTATVTTQPSCTVSTGTITITAPAGAGITYSTDGVAYTNTTGVFSGMASGNYNLTAKNSSGCISGITTVTVNAQPMSPNISQIPTSGLIANYKFNGNANDETGNNNGTLLNGPTPITDRFNISNAAYNFDGTSQYISTANSYTNPSDFTISIWFKTNTITGGKLIGFGNTQTGSSSSYDRHLYMNNAGQIYFGVYPGSVKAINSNLSYNDNNWHLAIASLSQTAGMALYIDGNLVASDVTTKTAQSYTGYWRIGYDNTNGWTSAPSSFYFKGILDDALIYSRSLSASEVSTLYLYPDGAGNNGPVCISSPLSLSATAVAGVTYSWTGPNSFVSYVQNPTLSYTTANAGTYKLIATSSGGCTSTAYTNVFSTTTPGQWTGNISTDWNNPSNWCDGLLPTSTTNVTIPSTVNNPIVSLATATAQNINIASGMSLTITGQTLQISGNITSSGIINAVNGSVEFNGSSAQSVSGSLFSGRTIKNLIVSNAGTGLSVSSAANDTLKISGTLSFGIVSSALSTGDNITLLSSYTNTANVDIVGPGNSITGKVTVERYINVGTVAGQHTKSWQFLATPTVGQKIIESWMENGILTSTGYGTQITGTGSGFDLTTPSPSLKYYNALTNSWTGVTNTANPVYNQEGYMLFVRGDRGVNGTTVKTPVSTTLRTKGNLFIGTLTPIPVLANKYGSIGNPYASPIDFTLIAKDAGIDNAFYAWDPYLYGSYGVGGYQTISSVNSWKPVPGGTTTYPTGVSSKTIQSDQAIFVHATGFTSNITFAESCKINSSSFTSFARPFGNPSPSERQFFAASLYAGTSPDALIADGNTVAFDKAFSDTIDGNDALKILNSGENFGIKRDGKILAIEARSPIVNTDTIYYYMSNLKQRSYQLRFAPQNMAADGLDAYLIDKFLNTSTSVSLTDSTFINIAISSDPASSATDRFIVIFKPMASLPVTFLSLKAYEKDHDIAVEWKVENESNMKQYDVEKSIDGNRFDKTASMKAINGSANNYSWLDQHAMPGYNYYKIRSVDINGKAGYTQVVKVLIEKSISQITIYPNPVTNGVINLQLTDQPAGVYGMRLLNALGQVIVSKIINHADGSSTERIQWDYNLAKGIYQLEVTKPDGTLKIIKVLN